MNFPLISEYIASIKNAEDNFDKLQNLKPVLDADGQPVMSSGNFAVVFKMTDGTKDYAVKCFLKEQQGRTESYQLIAGALEYVSSGYITAMKYLDDELFVDSANSSEQNFPVLQMDWVEGETLDNYLHNHIADSNALNILAYQFGNLAAWLMAQDFAHGDLKPDNILVKEDGSLVLVDYDGMFVPAMKGQKARELGSPNFRHPLRTEEDFDEHIDDFALVTIALSLKAIAFNPEFLDKYGAPDRLLLSEKDYLDISHSSFLKDEFPSTDTELNRLYATFLIALTQQDLSYVSFRLMNLSKPQLIEEEVLSTEVTYEEIEEGINYDFDGIYSKDRKRLLKYEGDSKKYQIRKGTKVIGDYAVLFCSALQSIDIPDSVTEIGDFAFSGCSALQSIHIPDSVTEIGACAFSDCSALQSINIPDSVTEIGEAAFSFCSALKSIHIPDSVTEIGARAFSNCNALQSIHIPDSVTEIGDKAFYRCYALQSIHIPDSVTEIGACAFSNCYAQSIDIPDSVTSIGEDAFSFCSALKSIDIPDSVTKIGDFAFCRCSALQSIDIPDSVTEIGACAFSNCSALQSINIPDSVTSIENNPFANSSIHQITNHSPHFKVVNNVLYTNDGKLLIAYCSTATTFNIPDSVTEIGDKAFDGCSALQSIHIPDSVTEIGAFAFYHCSALQSINIPDSVTEIGAYAFSFCSALQSIDIPDSVTEIGARAFSYCSALQSINIPDSVTEIGEAAFSDCYALQSIDIPDSVTSIGDDAFGVCSALQSIHIPKGTMEKFKGLLDTDLHSRLVEE